MVFDHVLKKETRKAVDELKAYGDGELNLTFLSTQGR